MSPTLIQETYDTLKERKEDLSRFNYQTSRINAVETAISINPMTFIEECRSFPLRPIFRIRVGNKILMLSRPILVKVYSDDGIFFAENETLAICGTGATGEEAIEDAKEHIVYFYKHYKNTNKSKLIGAALELKTIYKSIFA